MDHKQTNSGYEERTRRISRQVIYGLVGAVLYTLLYWVTSLFPIPALGSILFRPAVAILIFFGVAYGPWAGLLAGLIGSMASDFLTSLGYYWNWSLGHALTGMVAGFFVIQFKDFGKVREILRAIGGGMLFASLMEIFVSGIDPGTAVMEYFIPAFLGNFVCTVVLLPIFMIVFAGIVAQRARQLIQYSRTSLKELHYEARDYFMIGLGVAIVITCCVLKWGFGIGGYLYRGLPG